MRIEALTVRSKETQHGIDFVETRATPVAKQKYTILNRLLGEFHLSVIKLFLLQK